MKTIVVYLCAVLAFTAAGWAQMPLTLQGVVADPSGAVIPGATVTLSSPGAAPKTAQADANGKYSITGIKPGKYTLKAASTGFANYERPVEIRGDRPVTFDIPLKLFVETQQITVSDTSEVLLDASDPTRNVGAIVLKGEDLQMLSDNPDDLQNDLMALAGPAAGPNGGQIFIDGFSGGKLPPKESIREVRINQNPFSAEYDKLGFGRIEVFTKPGTDKFRGQAFFNFSDAIFNSRNPYALEKPPYQQRFFGGNVSGPITKKSSFFIDAERRNVDEVSVVNARTLDDGFNIVPYQTTLLNPMIRTEVDPRFDYQINGNNTLVARYSFDRTERDNQGVGNIMLPSRAYNNVDTDHRVQLTETAVLNAQTINETRFQYVGSRIGSQGDNSTPAVNVLDSFFAGGSPYGIAYTNEDRYELQNQTSINHHGHMTKFGGRLRASRLNDYSTQNYNGTYTFSTLDAYRLQLQGMDAGLTNEQIRAMGGGPSQFSIYAGNPLAAVTQWDVGVYVQDDWRMRPNFTVSSGLRYETQSNISNYANFAPRLGFAWGIGRHGQAPKTVIRGGFGIFYDRFDNTYTLQARRNNGINQLQFGVQNPNFYPLVPPVSELELQAASRAIQLVDSGLQASYITQFAIGVERQWPKNITTSVQYINSRGVHTLRSRNINAPLDGTANGPRPYGDVGNLYLYESSGLFKQNQVMFNTNARVNSKLMLFGFYVLNFANSNTDGIQTFPSNQYDLSSEWGDARFGIRHRVFFGGSITAPFRLQLNPFITASSGIPYNITIGRDLNHDLQFTDRPAFVTDPTRPSVVTTPLGDFDTQPIPGQTIIPRNYATGPGQVMFNLRVSRTWGFGNREAASSPNRQEGRMRTPGLGGMPPGGGGPGGAGRGGGGSPGGGGGGGGPMGGMFGGVNTGKKYNLTLSVSARNLLNHVNPGVPIGTLSSTLFGTSNQLAGGLFASGTANRRIDLQLRFTF